MFLRQYFFRRLLFAYKLNHFGGCKFRILPDAYCGAGRSGLVAADFRHSGAMDRESGNDVPGNPDIVSAPSLRCPCGAAAVCSALVIPAGFEPTTHSLEGCCSIQLSYETIVFALQM